MVCWFHFAFRRVAVMVVVRADRDDLALALRQLITGRLTNNEFDDGYYEKWYRCGDSAVAEIAKFGWGLYSSDVGAYKLKGRHAVSPAEQAMANRAILFLQTELDYEWPISPVGIQDTWPRSRPALKDTNSSCVPRLD
jgi:hypothetical protein